MEKGKKEIIFPFFLFPLAIEKQAAYKLSRGQQ